MLILPELGERQHFNLSYRTSVAGSIWNQKRFHILQDPPRYLCNAHPAWLEPLWAFSITWLDHYGLTLPVSLVVVRWYCTIMSGRFIESLRDNLRWFWSTSNNPPRGLFGRGTSSAIMFFSSRVKWTFAHLVWSCLSMWASLTTLHFWTILQPRL